ncbi:MAG: DnaK suppressor protein [Gammaproteobacteria bacterium]|jgi:DnaK suppressor protein|nr:DnaK suppressor protein [Gammaproteobacteria bacterium]
MPSKKPNKAAKRPGKATPKKAAHKAAAPKKAARPPTKAKPIATSKVTVKPSKPAMKPVSAKVAITKTPHAKPAAPKPAALKPAVLKPVPTPAALKTNANANAEKIAPIKFDPRPLVTPRMLQNDEDGDAESSGSASLLAGPRNVKPYIARRGEQYMNKEQLEHFARILQNWKRDLMVEVDRTVLHMKDEAANFPDPNDRATQEEEFSLELRTRDRERKLIRKIDEALKRIEDGSYGYCLETGEEIGIKRLEARPVATLSVEAQERRERREKQYGDRDDRYR